MSSKSEAKEVSKSEAKVKSEPKEGQSDGKEVSKSDAKEVNDVEKSKPGEGTPSAKTKEGTATKENEKPALEKTALQPLIGSLRKQIFELSGLIQPDLKKVDNIAEIKAVASSIKQLGDELVTLAARVKIIKAVEPKFTGDKAQVQYVAKVQGVPHHHIRDLRNLLQNALGSGMMKFSPSVRRGPFLEINFTTEEIMEKGIKILSDKPLGVTLTVVEAKRVNKKDVFPESLVDHAEEEFDPIVKFKESLLRSRELTEEECGKMVEWKEKYLQHTLTKLNKTLDGDIVMLKDRTDGFSFKFENLRRSDLSDMESERYQTFSGVNKETGKVEMGYWALGSDVPSRLPRSPPVKKVLKVLTDFMESTNKSFFDLRAQDGYWESITISTNNLGHCMVVLVARPSNVPDLEKDAEALKEQLSEFMEKGPGKECEVEVKSVHLKIVNEPGGTGTRNWYLLYGSENLEEEVAGIKLLLYKNAYFSDGACTEQLCDAIVKELGINNKTGVLEMGMAAGLICIYIAKRCKQICAYDRMQSIHSSAQEIADLNDLNNFVLKRGHTPSMVASFFKNNFKGCSNVCAVVTESSSNARSREELKAIRRSPEIKKVAYLVMSCREVPVPFKILCNRTPECQDAFVIVKAIPFDQPWTQWPNLLLVLERTSVAKRRPGVKVKGSSAPADAPAAKKSKLSDGPQSRGMNKKMGGGAPAARPLLSLNRDNMGRGLPRNPPQGSWFPENDRSPMMPYGGGGMNPSRMEEAAMMLERARMQEEAQIQQLQEAVLEAQRRTLVGSMAPKPQLHNLEEVVLTTLQKSGLLEKVSALAEVHSPRPQVEEVPRRNAEKRQHSADRWSSDHRQRDARSPLQENLSGYQGRNISGRNSPVYQDRDNLGYVGRDNSELLSRDASRFPDRDRDISRFPDRDSSRLQDRETSRFPDRDVPIFQDRDASRFPDRDEYRFQDRDVSRFQDRDASKFVDRDASKFPDRDVSRFPDRDVSRFPDRDASKFLDRNTPAFQDRDTSRFQDRDTFGFQEPGFQVQNTSRPLELDSVGFTNRRSPVGYPSRDLSLSDYRDREPSGVKSRGPFGYQELGSSALKGRDSSAPKIWESTGRDSGLNTTGGYYPNKSYGSLYGSK